MKKVKVIFLDASVKPQNYWKGAGAEFNGDETARLLQATIDEQEIDDYELLDSKVVHGSHGNTPGMTTGFILFFKKVANI